MLFQGSQAPSHTREPDAIPNGTVQRPRPSDVYSGKRKSAKHFSDGPKRSWRQDFG
jgi:hypothetical protein